MTEYNELNNQALGGLLVDSKTTSGEIEYRVVDPGTETAAPSVLDPRWPKRISPSWLLQRAEVARSALPSASGPARHRARPQTEATRPHVDDNPRSEASPHAHGLFKSMTGKARSRAEVILNTMLDFYSDCPPTRRTDYNRKRFYEAFELKVSRFAENRKYIR